MKKILYHTLSLLFASLFWTACAEETIVSTFGQGDEVTLTLHLSNGDLQSRATENGADEYNENAITKVDLYLYPTGGTGQALYKVSDTFTNTKGTATLTASLSNDLVETLFVSNGKCHAYALVNYTGEAPAHNTAASTIASLKALEITPNSAAITVDEASVRTFDTTPQPSFVMDGESAEITYSDTDKKVTGTIPVYRAASKIALFVTGVDKTVTDDAGYVWEPDITKMDISFHNGVNKAKVDVGYSNSRPNNTLTDGNYYNSSVRSIAATVTNTEATEATAWELTTNHAPFYSYSSDWGRADDKDEEPTLTLMVPWRKIKDPSGNAIAQPAWQTCYYQIPINVESTGGSLTNCFERNMYYKVSLHVGILGDFNPSNPVTLDANYYTVDWTTENVDVDVKNYKYLVVDKNDVTVYNENEIRIGYVASDDIKAEITYIRRPDYSEAKTDTTVFYGSWSQTSGISLVNQNTNDLMSSCAVTVSDEEKEIVLRHDLVNKTSDDDTSYDYVPYYIRIKVTMTVKVNGVDKTFTEWIDCEQYPAIYVKAYLNSDYDVDATNRNNNGWIETDNDNNGYVFVNGYQGNNYSNNGREYHSWPEAWVLGYSNQQYLGSARGMSSNATNKNPNMYVINVSALPEGSSYVIGDPRVKRVDTELRDAKFTSGQQNGNSIWVTAKVLNSTTTRKLIYPYPTDVSVISSTGTGVDNYTTGYMIAPRIRVASSYSVLSSDFVTDKEIARRRCASYQEDGYPAGRWRLPTFAEGDFIVRLSAEGKIPTLFTSGSEYWCAHGYFEPNNNTKKADYYNSSTNDGASVRCVYDEWYWGDSQLSDKTVFTWGDAER